MSRTTTTRASRANRASAPATTTTNNENNAAPVIAETNETSAPIEAAPVADIQATSENNASEPANNEPTTASENNENNADKIAAAKRAVMIDKLANWLDACDFSALSDNDKAALYGNGGTLSVIGATQASAAILAKYETINAISAMYAPLTAAIGKDGYKDLISRCRGIRYETIDRAAAGVKTAVTYDGQITAALNQARKSHQWPTLAKYIGIDTSADNATAARAFIAAYYTDVDESGAPLRAAYYASNDGRMIYGAYVPIDLSARNAASIFLRAVDGVKTAAYNAIRTSADNATSKRAKVREPRRIVAAWYSGKYDNGAIYRDKLERGNDGRALSAAAFMSKYADKDGRGLTIDGLMTVREYNAAMTK